MYNVTHIYIQLVSAWPAYSFLFGRTSGLYEKPESTKKHYSENKNHSQSHHLEKTIFFHFSVFFFTAFFLCDIYVGMHNVGLPRRLSDKESAC